MRDALRRAGRTTKFTIHVTRLASDMTSSLKSSLVALAAVAVAVTVRVLLQPLLNDSLPFITLFLAISVAAWYGGARSGALALVCGGIVAALLLLPQGTGVGGRDTASLIGLALYVVVGCAIIALFSSRRNALLAIESQQMQLRGEIETRRATERTLADQADRLNTTLASIGDGVITTDCGGNITSMNVVAETLTGWTATEAAGTSLDLVFRTAQAIGPLTAENLSVMATGERLARPFETRTVLLGRDGAGRHIDGSTAPIRRRGGDVLGYVVVFRDETERVKHEHELEEREQLFRTLAQSIPQLAWMANPNGHVFWYNRRWYEYTGTTEEQMRGAGWQQVHDLHELPRLMERWKESVATGTPFDKTYPLKGRDGHYRSFLTRIEPLTNDAGEVVRWFGTSTDVSAHERAEAALRASEARYRAATSAVSDVIWTNDGTGSMTGDQPGWAAFTGQTREEYEGLGWAKAVHPEDASATVDAWTEAVAARRPFSFEHRVCRYDGEWRICSIRAVPITLKDGTLVEWVGVHTDITERRRDEDALRELAAELSDADRRKDEFLATLAHELRNPLAPIRNGLQVLRLANGQAAAIEQVRVMMERQLTQMVRLIDDLMDVSRISRGRIELRREHLSLSAVLESALEASRPLIDQMGHELTVTVPAQPVIVDADSTRLTQVFLNLLNNAAKYGEPGGQIHVDVECSRTEAIVRVRDTGIGIPADQLPRIFDMFAQLDRSLGKSQGGLGIGLALAKRLVEMHGGVVEVASDGPGTGSEFTVRLPVVVREVLPHSAGDDVDLPTTSSMRILIVDDNHDSADSLATVLRLLGNDVRTAYDGQQGVEEADTFRPHAIVLDIGLPKLTGHEVSRRIRATPWGNRVMLVAMTGWGQDDDRRRTLEAGFDHHVVKPVRAQVLLSLLAAAPRSDR